MCATTFKTDFIYHVPMPLPCINATTSCNGKAVSVSQPICVGEVYNDIVPALLNLLLTF
jgi:hypothetical protein